MSADDPKRPYRWSLRQRLRSSYCVSAKLALLMTLAQRTVSDLT
jgi:hypothetical protein